MQTTELSTPLDKLALEACTKHRTSIRAAKHRLLAQAKDITEVDKRLVHLDHDRDHYITVHRSTVLESLRHSSITGLTKFKWLNQLRQRL